MIDSQTFASCATRGLTGAERITGPKLWRIFRERRTAERTSGFFISAISYLESWGDAKAESPAGPKGIMQIAGATARHDGP